MPVCTNLGDGFVTHLTDAHNPDLGDANAARTFEVSRSDLPLSCPTSGQKLWNAHPRVYLAIEKTGEATCPYCGCHYRLVD